MHPTSVERLRPLLESDYLIYVKVVPDEDECLLDVVSELRQFPCFLVCDESMLSVTAFSQRMNVMELAFSSELTGVLLRPEDLPRQFAKSVPGH